MTGTHPKPDLVIFDCDGVLVDSEVLSCQCLSEVLGECGIALSEDEAVELFLGRSTAAVLDHYRDDCRFVPDAFLPELKSRVLQRFSESLCPIPGIDTVVSRLESPFCVASSSDLDRVSRSLALTGLAPLFGDRLYTAQMVPRGKPAPDLFLYAAAQMRTAPPTHAGDRRQRQRRDRGQGRRHGGVGICRRQPLCLPRRARHAIRCRRRQGVRPDDGLLERGIAGLHGSRA